MEDVNSGQQTGGSPNTPSTTPSNPSTNVDNNGNPSTGSASIDEPTPTTPPASTGGNTIVNGDGGNPAGAWGGTGG